MAQGRGVLTPEVQEVAKNLLGYELTVRELRLMPYLQYTVMNDKRINPNHINLEERLRHDLTRHLAERLIEEDVVEWEVHEDTIHKSSLVLKAKVNLYKAK